MLAHRMKGESIQKWHCRKWEGKMNLVKKILKDNKGQYMVLFALMIPVLCGFIGLAVDLGYVMIQKQKLQDSVDLAVLSGAQGLPLPGPVELEVGSSECLNLLSGLTLSKAEKVAIKVFEDNYGECLKEQNLVNPTEQNIVVSQNEIKVNYKNKVELFFMPIFNVNEVSITAIAKARTGPIKKPGAIVPFYISCSDKRLSLNPSCKDNLTVDPLAIISDPTAIILWGPDKKDNGNFGIINPTSNNKTSVNPQDLRSWVENDYSAGNGWMPSVNDEIYTEPGMTVGQIKTPFEERIAKGDNIVFATIVDVSCKGNKSDGLNGKSPVCIKGFLALETYKDAKGNVKGKVRPDIDPKGLIDPTAFDYGLKGIELFE
jgi:hypothetical protein